MGSRLVIGCRMFVGALATMFAPLPSAATLQYYDPFAIGVNPAAGEYALGPVGGQNPTVGPTPFFTGAWTVFQEGAGNSTVEATSLDYVGTTTIGGSLLSTPNARPQRSLTSPWTAATSGTYYMGFFVNFGQGDYSDGVSGNDMGYRAVEFWRDDGTFLMNIAYNTYSGTPAQTNPLTGRMYHDWSGFHQILPNAPPSFSQDGRTHLVVIEFVLSSTAASDSLKVYLDPPSTSVPELVDASLSGIDITLGAMGGATIFGGSGTFPVFDEFRVGSEFADVLPPGLPCPGDTDGNCVIDLTDYATIRDNFHRTDATRPQDGDVARSDGSLGFDGRVDLGDFWLWKRKYEEALSGRGAEASTNVPEPSTLVLLLGACCSPGWLRKKRSHNF